MPGTPIHVAGLASIQRTAEGSGLEPAPGESIGSMPTILVATRDGVHTFDDEGQARGVAQAGRSVTALGRAREEFWAIVDTSELWHATGADWSHVTDLDGLRATCVAGIGADVFASSSVPLRSRRSKRETDPPPD